jgi:excisionase family DNA binding protein
MERLLLNQITVEELADQLVAALRKDIGTSILKPEPPERYLSRNEAAKLLRISLPTLNEWSKNGILESYKIGGRILYKQSEIEGEFTAVKHNKYKR